MLFYQVNINNYGLAVMLSVNISAYKGGVPRNHVLVCILFFFHDDVTFSFKRPQDILKRYRFDLPEGIEHDYANWEKISTYVSYALTQNRSKVKKAVCDYNTYNIDWRLL